jgi:hypothetical protein
MAKRKAERPAYNLNQYLNPMRVASRTNENLLSQVPLAKKLEEISLSTSVRLQLERLIDERRDAVTLAKADLLPPRSLALLGASGWGKTTLAAAIAHELNCPCFSARHGTVFSSYLGETGGNLEKLAGSLAQLPLVLLLDEFDSFAQTRKKDDVGEMKRVVNTLLQVLDRLPPTTLIVVCSNLPQLIDAAAWRRFEVVCQIGPCAGTYEATSEWADAVRRVFSQTVRGAWSHGLANGYCQDLVDRSSSPSEAERIGLSMARFAARFPEASTQHFDAEWKRVLETESDRNQAIRGGELA